MQAAYPSPGAETAVDTLSESAEPDMERVIEVITGIRNIRGEMNIQPSLSLAVSVQSDDESFRNTISSQQGLIQHLAKLKSLTVEPAGTRPSSAATAVAGSATIYVFLEGILDVEKESVRLTKEIGKVTAEITGVSKKLANQDFLDKAPEAIIDKVREKHGSLQEKIEKLQNNLERLKEIG